MRLVLGPDGEIAVDAAGGGFGRGAHVHARGACIEQAATRGLQRASKGRASSVSVAVKEGGDVATTDAERLSAPALADAIEARDGAADRRPARDGGAHAQHAGGLRRRDGLVARRGRGAHRGRDRRSRGPRPGSRARRGRPVGAAVAWGTKATLAAALFRGTAPRRAWPWSPSPTRGSQTRCATRSQKAMGAHDAKRSVPRDVRQSVPRAVKPTARADVRPPVPGGGPDGVATPRRGVKVAAPRAGNRGKVNARRAGRASGRRARVTKAVAERGE